MIWRLSDGERGFGKKVMIWQWKVSELVSLKSRDQVSTAVVLISETPSSQSCVT